MAIQNAVSVLQKYGQNDWSSYLARNRLVIEYNYLDLSHKMKPERALIDPIIFFLKIYLIYLT